jgi:enoyl-[acyl-carrier protein] reductase III
METLGEVPRHRAGRQRITAVCVCPVPIDTDSFRFYAGEQRDLYENNWLALTPSAQFPTPDQIADVMAFLCSSRSAVINGQAIVLDGDMSLATLPIDRG